VRPLTGRKDVEVGNIFSAFPVVPARSGDENMTIAELGTQMRNAFKAGGKRRDWLTALKTCWSEYDPRTTRGLTPLLSSAGAFKLKDPVVDFWGQQAMKDKLIGTLLLICQSIILPDGVKAYMRLQYPPTRLSAKDANLFFQLIMHTIQKIPVTATLREAVDELRRFRREANL
jgi:hypothetical protein